MKHEAKYEKYKGYKFLHKYENIALKVNQYRKFIALNPRWPVNKNIPQVLIYEYFQFLYVFVIKKLCQIFGQKTFNAKIRINATQTTTTYAYSQNNLFFVGHKRTNC